MDEPATVTINGQSAKVMSTDGGAPYKFEGVVTLDAGANTVVVEAKDGQNNTRTKTYAVTTTGDSKKFEYDGNGNLRYEKQPNGTVIREYRWDQQNRLVRFLQGTHESVYEYDGESHRVRIKELTSSVETKNETFVWCGQRICQKRNSGGIVRSYFPEGFEESSSDYFYTRDHLGSTREVVASNGMRAVHLNPRSEIRSPLQCERPSTHFCLRISSMCRIDSRGRRHPTLRGADSSRDRPASLLPGNRSSLEICFREVFTLTDPRVHVAPI